MAATGPRRGGAHVPLLPRRAVHARRAPRRRSRRATGHGGPVGVRRSASCMPAGSPGRASSACAAARAASRISRSGRSPSALVRRSARGRRSGRSRPATAACTWASAPRTTLRLRRPDDAAARPERPLTPVAARRAAVGRARSASRPAPPRRGSGAGPAAHAPLASPPTVPVRASPGGGTVPWPAWAGLALVLSGAAGSGSIALRRRRRAGAVRRTLRTSTPLEHSGTRGSPSMPPFAVRRSRFAVRGSPFAGARTAPGGDQTRPARTRRPPTAPRRPAVGGEPGGAASLWPPTWPTTSRRPSTT